MGHIFISYASGDRARAEILAAALERHGWSVWSDREIPPGKTFDQVIEEALDAAQCVIVLWSKQSVTSNWVKSEASEGLRRGILVPALIDDVRIPLEFSRIQAARLVDWEGKSTHPEFERLVRAVQPILGQPLRMEVGHATLGETPEGGVSVVEPEKEPAQTREPGPPRGTPPVDTPPPARTAGPFHHLSVQKVFVWLIGVTLLAVAFWVFQERDRVIQVVPAPSQPVGSLLQKEIPKKQAPERSAVEGWAVKPSEPTRPAVSRAPPPKPTPPVTSTSSPPKPSQPIIARAPAPELTPKDVGMSLSLNNTKIAFGSDRYGVLEINVMKADGADPKRMTATLDRQPAWSPDGRMIAFVSSRDGNREIYVMNANGGNQKRLTKTPAGEFDPAWSPDGKKITFVSDRDGNREIYVMNANGSDPKRVTRTPAAEFEPAWSPNGGKIAFASERDGNREIYVMNADGSNPTRLTNSPGKEFNPSWSPDGKKIAFASEHRGNREIYVMNADGGEPSRLTDNPAFDDHPAWSPDGRKIAFASYRAHNYDIYVMNADGSNPKRLTTTPGDDEHPSWSPFLK